MMEVPTYLVGLGFRVRVRVRVRVMVMVRAGLGLASDLMMEVPTYLSIYLPVHGPAS